MRDRSLDELRKRLQEGLVIPACPLALTKQRKFDERHERALLRYYLASGAGGLAVGVHTTQFEIHDPKVGLYKPVLELAAETAREFADQRIVKVAGLVGKTEQAIQEATLAVSLGYDCGLLSLAAFRAADLGEIMEHCEEVAKIIPLFGFYLQPAVGGRMLPYAFWRRFVEIENIVAIKIAPFNRYQTLDVVRAVAESGRATEIALYTGNDDHIVDDLVTEFRFSNDEAQSVHMVGGLLGHWAVWTSKAVSLLATCKQTWGQDVIPGGLLTLGAQVTDSNAALFDVAHNFAGCIAGIHEVLVQQGLMSSRCCLNPAEDLSPGQAEEIARVRAAYPHLTDDSFVAEHLDEWLA